MVNPLNAELNPICHLLALFVAHHILHVSRIKVNIKINKMCFYFLYNFVSNIHHPKKNWACYDEKKKVYWSSCKIPVYSCHIVMRLEFSGHIFDMSSNIKFHENSLSGSRTVSSRRPDINEEANSRFSQFCKRATQQQDTKQDSTMASLHLIH